jgi:hypothetical protein
MEPHRIMRRAAAPLLALIVILGLVTAAQSDPDPGVSLDLPTLAEHNALEGRVTDTEADLADLEDRVTALEEAATPTDPPTDPPPTDPTDPPDPVTFPTRSSVGPDIDPTELYAGACYFGAARSGEVIEAKIIDCDAAGGVRFAPEVTGVIFRDSIIRGQMLTTGNTAGDASADTYPREPVFTVEDSRIVQSTTAEWQDRAACCSHYVIKRSLIQGTHSGLAVHNNAVLEGNFITTDGTDSHSSGARILRNAVIQGNTFQCKPVTPGKDGGCSAAAVFYREALGNVADHRVYNLTIAGNYFKRGVTPVDPDTGEGGEPGGPWFATRFAGCDTRDDCVDITFTDNVFDLGWGTDGGEFPDDAGDVWADNTWIDGEPATSGQGR